MDIGARSKVHVPYQRLEQEAEVPAPSAATGTAGSIGNIGTVSGNQSPTVVGAGQVIFHYNSPPETAAATVTVTGDVTTSSPNANPSSPSPSPIPSTQASGVPAPRPQHSQRPDQEPRLMDPCQEAGNKTRDKLKIFYKTTGSYVQLLPGVDNDQKHITGIYTKVQLETREGLAEVTDKKGETVNSTEYAKIFRLRTKTGELIKRLIFYGMGGVGKSTIFDKIAFDWAEEASEILKRFELVFLLKMYALSQESDLVASTFDQLLGEDSGIATDELDQIILASPNEVLILLDGFDEMSTKTLNAASFGSILKALNRTKYRECVICVSTRPSHLEKLTSKSLIQNPCTHVEVLGFTDEDVNEYIRKFYKEDRDSGKALIQTISKSNAMSDLANNPMLLLLMCLLWRESEQLPETSSRLFSEAVDYMFTRKPEISGEDVPKTLIAIGKTALQGLIGANQYFSFQEDEFESKALDIALRAGILTQQRVIKNRKSHNNIQFTHKTMQEYCAATYLQSVHMSNRGLAKRAAYKVAEFGEFHKNLKQLCLRIEGVVSNDFLLRFCCGDNEKCMKDIVKFLDRKFGKDRDRPMYQSGVIQAISRNCVFESQSGNVPRCLTSDSLIPSTISVYGNSDLRSLVHLLKIMCRSADSHMTRLAPVETIKVSRVSSVKDLAFALDYMKTLRNLRFYSCPLAEGDLEKTLTSLKCNQLLTDLCIKSDSTLGGRAIEWAPHIKHLTSLNKLEISYCKLQGTDIEHIASSIRDMPRLTDLILAGNTALGGSADSWTKNLLRFTNVETLNLSNCALQWTDIEHIAFDVNDMPSLTDLILSDNPALDVSATKLSCYLLRVKEKHTLDLSNFSLTGKDLGTIYFMVNHIPALTTLILAGNTKLGGSMELRAMNLLRLNNVHTWNMSNCSLQWTDIEHIAWVVSDMPRLTDLILSDNPALDVSTEKLSRYLLRVKQKDTLDLSNFSLTWEDIGTISAVIKHIPELINLSLAGNTSLGGSAELWVNNLSRLRTLLTLNLSNCALQWTDIKHIASAVSDMPRLTDLILAGNTSLGGSAELWVRNLSRFTNIQTLNLSNCALQWTDIKHIASAVSDMPRLTDLILTDNPALGVLTEKWSRYLLRVKEKHTLDLSNSSLTWEDVGMICVVVSHIPAMTDLILAGNKSLGGSAELSVNIVSPVTNIQTLNLSNCALQWTDIEYIASSASDMPRLTDLILAGNKSLGGSADLSVNNLSRFTNIQTLNLSNCALQWTDIEHIASSASDMPRLTDLILAGNTALGGWARWWAQDLSRFTNIKTLNLSNCTLQCTDIEFIVSAVRDMRRLTDLILAYNTALCGSPKLWAKHFSQLTNIQTLNLSNCTVQFVTELTRPFFFNYLDYGIAAGKNRNFEKN
ncbi:NACHT, LRR and PYD domains-containing protein 3-like isoform X1 [Patiria miniata]|uniref:NACHT domain-containing protein n=1 Tax=Patiria miniata TaxID=46514 RepID=A0A913Z0X7_PATMI|nr:NACHT, LRR and PYD domains-containing protein 3-like isoform X1 [Patiria miniata]